MVEGEDISPETPLAQNNPNFTWCRTVYNTLTEYDHKTLQPMPSLATSWQLRDHGATLVMNLRSDVKYHTGRPFGPADVLWVLNYVTQPSVSSQVKYIAAVVKDASKTGPHQITLRFAQPVNSLFDMFEMLIMIDRESVKDLLDGKSFIGTGPFKVTHFTPGSGLSMVRNAKYWKKGHPYLDAVETSVIKESSSMLSSLQSGESQLALDLDPLDTGQVRSNPQLELVVSDADDSTFYVASNVTVKPLNDVRVRQAIAWAIDRKRILSQVLAGIGRISCLPWSPSSPAYSKTEGAHYHHDVAKAKALLTAAKAIGAPVNIYYNTGLGTDADIANIVLFDLTAAGLKPTAVPMEAANFFTQLTGPGFDGLFIQGHGFGQMHPATLVEGSFPFNANKNASQFNNAQYKKLAAGLSRASTKAGAQLAYKKLNKLFLEQQFVNDLVVSSHTFAISRKLKGLSYTMLDYINLDDAYLS